MTFVRSETVGLLEAAYRLELSNTAWLEELAAALDRALQPSIGASAYRFRMEADGTPRIDEFVGPPWLEQSYRQMMEGDEIPPGVWELFHCSGNHVSSVSERLRTIGIEVNQSEQYRKYYHPRGVFDILGVCAANPDGSGIVVSAPMEAETSPSRRGVEPLVCAAVHIAAASRLRAALGEAAPLDSADAILTPEGKVEHAEPQARGRLGSLRDAVARLAEARKAARSDPDRALELWQGLVDGTWSMVDCFDSDDRRFVVARKNDPDLRDPRALTRRERQVVYYATTHDTDKLIGYELGLAPSTVASILQRAIRKLGVSSRAELIHLARSLNRGRSCP